MSSRYGVTDLALTLQGEGSRTGSKVVRVFFSGCNLWDGNPLHREEGEGPCARWCDADFLQGTVMDLDDLLEKMGALWPVSQHEDRWCFLTGGEPALQVNEALMEALRDDLWHIAVETNGTVANKAMHAADHICLSPKRGTQWRTFGWCHELKVVLPGVMAPGAQGWTNAELLAMEREFAHLCIDAFVQPQDPILGHGLATLLKNQGEEVDEMDEDTREDTTRAYSRNLKRCVDWVLQHPAWRLSQQTQKFSGLG